MKNVSINTLNRFYTKYFYWLYSTILINTQYAQVSDFSKEIVYQTVMHLCVIYKKYTYNVINKLIRNKFI